LPMDGIPMQREMDSEKLFQLLRFHLDNHEGISVQDIYKCLYQGVRGAEHLLTDRRAAQDYLEKEWHNVEAKPESMLIEPVSIDMSVFRLNLSPYKAMGGTCEYVWNIFERSAQHFISIPDRLAELWQEFIKLCTAQKFSFQIKEVMEFSQYLKLNNYPVHHHSQAYKEKNSPAYRVIHITELFNFT
jgi:hypothetical protein